MKEKVFNLLLLFLPLWTMAQNSYNISGTVTDAEQAPLAGATIKFMKEGRKSEVRGTATGNGGRFTLQLPKGNYEMEVSYLGYADHLSTVRLNDDTTLPAIRLDEKSQEIGEVTVTARTITYHSNGYVAEIAKDHRLRTKEMNEILRLLPATYTTNSTVEAYGERVAAIYVDGRELNLHGEALLVI